MRRMTCMNGWTAQPAQQQAVNLRYRPHAVTPHYQQAGTCAHLDAVDAPDDMHEGEQGRNVNVLQLAPGALAAVVGRPQVQQRTAGEVLILADLLSTW